MESPSPDEPLPEQQPAAPGDAVAVTDVESAADPADDHAAAAVHMAQDGGPPRAAPRTSDEPVGQEAAPQHAAAAAPPASDPAAATSAVVPPSDDSAQPGSRVTDDVLATVDATVEGVLDDIEAEARTGGAAPPFDAACQAGAMSDLEPSLAHNLAASQPGASGETAQAASSATVHVQRLTVQARAAAIVLCAYPLQRHDRACS